MKATETPVKKTEKSKFWKNKEGKLVPFKELNDEQLSEATRISESLLTKYYYLAEKLEKELKKAKDIRDLHTDLVCNLDAEKERREVIVKNLQES